MSDLVKEYNRTGECKLDIEAVLRHDWRVVPGKRTKKICRDTFVQKYKNPEGTVEWCFVTVRRFNVCIKVSISESQALSLIRELQLIGRPSRIFRRHVTYRKNWDYIDRVA